MEPFDYIPALKELLKLYEERTDNWVSDAPDWSNSDPDCRVTWNEIYECMKKHGYKGDDVDANVNFYNIVGGKWRRGIINIRRKYGEIR